MNAARSLAADLIGAKKSEIALLGPTSLGLSLVAAGLPWQPGDEILCYQDDYPANVYPWMELERKGVKVNYITPNAPGEITPQLVAEAITPKTKLVALASCHFFSGYRIDIDAIGKLAHESGALFCLDAIQTTGAFPTSVEHVDFLSADSHKWLLGPAAAGIFYVAEEHFELLRPVLLGAWNIHSPGFVAQEEIVFEKTARRYEPGVINVTGVAGMRAGLEMLLGLGIDTVAARIMDVKATLVAELKQLGFAIVEPVTGSHASGITTAYRSGDGPPIKDLFKHLMSNDVVVSFRENRAGDHFLRFSPHFYNTVGEIDRIADLIRGFDG